MSISPIAAITRNIVIKYHLLGLLIVINYLLIGLPSKIFQESFPVLMTAGLCLLAAEFIFHPKRPSWNSSVSALTNQKQQFVFDLSFYVFTVLVILLIEVYLLNQPAVFVEKSAAAIISIGVYVATGLALEVEYACIKNNLTTKTGNRVTIVPAGLKLRYFLLAILTVDWLIFALLYLNNMNPYYPLQTGSANSQELVFVNVLIVGFSAYLFYLYQRNFVLVLDIQVNTLFYVENGNFDTNVSIISDDEFALLAEYHNALIERIKDRERVYRILEKSVGANIMNKLLTTDEQTLKQGQSYSVAILFCDLRGFTSLSESASAEDVILFLNDYFADVSAVISQYNGIINKFMGDAVLAIFGLENEGNAVQDAVNASMAIIQHNIELYMPNEMHPETGVGIDFGWVVGGTIGSEERYEYTIIGDAVNKASRLEGLSKRLDYSIILSNDAYQQLSDELREHFCDLGEHKVRGRNEGIKVYGCGKKHKKTADIETRRRR